MDEPISDSELKQGTDLAETLKEAQSITQRTYALLRQTQGEGSVRTYQVDEPIWDDGVETKDFTDMNIKCRIEKPFSRTYPLDEPIGPLPENRRCIEKDRYILGKLF